MDNYKLATSTWDESEYEAMNKVIQSGNFSMGKKTLEFEKLFAQYFGSKYGVMVNSGSSANLIMLSSLLFSKKYNLKKGDEVIVTSVSWSTTYSPLQQLGLKVKFIDIDIDTLNIDLNILEKAITEKTKLIFLVNLLGNPNDFERINKLCKKNKIIILEDNCESLGAKFKNKFTGTFGLMGSFSTFFSHHISTMEGGVVLTDDEELYHIMLSLRAHGWTRNLPLKNKVTGDKSNDPFEESYKFVLPGYNLRPLEISAAIGIEQIKKIEDIIEGRRKNALLFQELFNNKNKIFIQKEISESSWFGFSLITNKNLFNRNELISILENNNIEYRPIVAGNFLKNDVIKYFDYEIAGELRNAKYLDENGLFIGNHHFDISKHLIKLSKLL